MRREKRKIQERNWMYKVMSYELKDKMDDAANVFFKEPTLPDEVLQYREPVDPKELLAGLTLEKLNAIYKSIIRRQEDKVDPIRSKFGTIEKEEVSLSDKMIEIKDFARTHRKFSFRNLLESQCSIHTGTDENGTYPCGAGWAV